MTDDYVLRRYSSADRGAFLDLFSAVLGGSMGEEWFTWKYVDNPYSEHVPIVVAETAGRLVGARACLPLRMAAGDRSYAALQPCDTMVREEHRRQGLFTRMTERVVDWFGESTDFFFNFPNHNSLPGNRKLGWRVVDAPPTYYRVQNPAAFGVGTGALGRRLARAYLGARDLIADGGTFDVRWTDRVPASLLGHDDGRLRAARDPTFYDWRLDNPLWSYAVAVATEGDGPVAALVVGTRTTADGTAIAQFADALPVGDATDRDAALAACMDSALDRHADADLVRALDGGALPSSALAARGFHSDARFPLSRVATPTVHVARPVSTDEGEWTVDGLRLDDPSSWRVTLLDVDNM